MADKIKFKITGAKELDKRLKRLEANVGKKVLRNALMHATLPVLQAAKAGALALRDSGALAASIKRFTRFTAIARGAVGTVFIGPKSRDARALAAWSERSAG